MYACALGYLVQVFKNVFVDVWILCCIEQCRPGRVFCCAMQAHFYKKTQNNFSTGQFKEKVANGIL